MLKIDNDDDDDDDDVNDDNDDHDVFSSYQRISHTRANFQNITGTFWRVYILGLLLLTAKLSLVGKKTCFSSLSWVSTGPVALCTRGRGVIHFNYDDDNGDDGHDHDDDDDDYYDDSDDDDDM